MSSSSLEPAVRAAMPSVQHALAAHQDEAIALSHRVHDRPETRFVEHQASADLTKTLRDNGFEITTAVAEMPTAFLARYTFDSDGPTLGVFCEYDALPEIGHACGHNIIAAAGAFGAITARDVLREGRHGRGTLVVVGSPGEEGGGGKVKLLNAGVLDDLEAAIMVHPAGFNAAHWASLGRISLEATFSGRPAHAAAAPEDGRNALDAATLMLVAIGLLRQQLQDGSRVHANVVEGGTSVNVIPDRAVVRAFVRSDDLSYLNDRLFAAVQDCARGAAIAAGVDWKVAVTSPTYEPVVGNPALVEMADSALTLLGRPSRPGDGAGSTDMGNVSQKVPTCHAYVQVNAEAGLHTREFAVAAGSPAGDRAVVDGAALLASMAVAYLGAPGVAAAVRASAPDALGDENGR